MAHFLGAAPRSFLDAVLRTYSQIFFSRSRLVGVLLIASTAVEPRMLLHGLIAVAVAAITARLLRFDDLLIEEGLYGYNALLVGLGTAALLESDLFAMGVLAAGSVLSVFATAASRSGTSANGLPILTAPFLAVYYLVIATTTSLGLSLAPLPTGPEIAFLPDVLELYLKSLGMIFFVPRLDAGLLLFAGLVLHSRIATMFSVVGLLIAYLVMQVSALSVLAGDVFPMLLTLNVMFTSIALGGVWFVPSRSSLLLAVVGAAAAAALTISAAPILAQVGLPILILPFNVTTWLILYALRQRTQDGSPKSVDFVPGTPEENFVYHRTHVLRFGAHYATRIKAPFNGVWVCTQGVDGEHTHQGVWRHAFDFEVQGSDGETHSGTGANRTDYYCYDLPALAPAAGTVMQVVDDVPDNEVGVANTEQNWGNLVLLYHGPGLYSMMCHLVPHSVSLKVGDWVHTGQPIGRCGNSGRSPVPHLHFQLQSVPRIGAPTIHTELHGVVHVTDKPYLVTSAVVAEGDTYRNIRVDESLESRFACFSPGSKFTLETDGRTEAVEVAIDLTGRKVLRSDRGATLYFEQESDRFIVLDVVGPRTSALHVLRAALGHVPFDDEPGLTWTDHLPLGLVYGPIVRSAYEFVAPFVDRGGVSAHYSMKREDGHVVIEGRTSSEAGGEPRLTTRAVLGPQGLLEASMTTQHRCINVTQIVPQTDAPTSEIPA